MQLIYDDQNDEQNRPRARQKKKNVCYVSDARARTFNFPENLIGRVGRKT